MKFGEKTGTSTTANKSNDILFSLSFLLKKPLRVSERRPFHHFSLFCFVYYAAKGKESR